MKSEPCEKHRVNTMKSIITFQTALCIVVIAYFNGPCAAQIATDGSLGSGVAQSLFPANGVTQISAELGHKSNTNLFHSFSQFNVGLGDTANFTGPTDIRNIIVRVTGGSASQINGTLRSRDIPSANLFLMNPAGVMFGPAAQLDIDGTFIATTANVIRMQDGGVFHASLTQPSVLTSAPPAAFGFLSANPSPIQVRGATLQTSPGQSLGLVGGDVSIVAEPVSLPDGTVQIVRGRLVSPGGQIAVVAVKSAGEVTGVAQLPATLKPSADVTRGDVTIDKSDVVAEAIGTPFSTVSVTANNLMLTAADVATDTTIKTTIPAVGPSVIMDLTGDLTLNLSRIITNTHSAGAAGDVAISANGILIDGLGIVPGSTIGSNVFSSGPSGSTNITTGTLTLLRFAGLGNATFAEGSVNPTIINAEHILVDGLGVGQVEFQNFPLGTGIISFVGPGATGDGGEVLLTAESLTIRNSGTIFLATLGAGDAGTLMINASDVLIDGEGFSLPNGQPATGITVQSAASSTGAGGRIAIDARTVTMLRGGGLSAASDSTGDAGQIEVFAETLTINRLGLPGTTFDPQNPAPLTGILASTSNTGQGGSIIIGSEDRPLTLASIVRGGAIVSEVSGSEKGGGIIKLFALSLELDGQDLRVLASGGGNLTGLSTIVDFAATAPGGDIEVHALDISMRNTATIQASTFSLDPLGRGQAGDIFVNAQVLEMESGASIAGNTLGQSNGGNVTVLADTIKVSGKDSPDFGSIFSFQIPQLFGTDIELAVPTGATIISTSVFPFFSVATGSAGLVSITAHNLLEVSQGGTIASSTFSVGNGMGVRIRAGDMNLSRGGKMLIAGKPAETATGVFAASVGTGNSGFIDIKLTGTLNVTDGGLISVDTFGSGVGGNLTIEAADIFMSSLPSRGLTGVAAQTHDSPDFGFGADGGNVRLITGRLTLNHQSFISATSSAAGAAGSVRVDVDELLIKDNSSILSASFGGLVTSGNGGNITINAARNVTLTSAGSIIVDARVPGTSAGEIIMRIGSNFSMFNGTISARSAGTGGNISISAGGRVQLRDSELTARAAVKDNSAIIRIGTSPIVSDGGGGSPVVLDLIPRFVILHGSTIDGETEDGTDIPVTIQVPALFLRSESDILTDAAVLPTELDLSGNLIGITEALAERRSQPSESCHMLIQSLDRSYGFKFDGFAPVRDGVPPQPSGWLPSLDLHFLGEDYSGGTDGPVGSP